MSKAFKIGCFGIIGVFALLVLIAFITMLFNGEVKETIESSGETKTTENKNEEKDPDAKIKEAAAPTIGKVTEIKVNDDAGKDDGGKIILIHIKQDNITKNVSDFQTTESLEKVFKLDNVNEITYFWEATIVNAKGNESVETVNKIQMSKATAESINWEKFTHKNLDQVADQYASSPLLK